MAKFIKLTQDNSADEYFVNPEHIVQFWTRGDIKYSVVELDTGKNLTVKKTPQDIFVMIG
jgi:hypothetical protein